VLGAQRLFAAWLEGQIASAATRASSSASSPTSGWSGRRASVSPTWSGKVPMTPQTKFRMASHSKLFTAVAIMQLREQGKLRLDDPVASTCRGLPCRPQPDDGTAITIEQLLTHSSGCRARRPTTGRRCVPDARGAKR
jgi:D-alanyl-D-alanine carboxypeptidase